MIRVECYRNLHTGTYSVRDLEGYGKGKVTGHPTGVIIDNATFAVQPAGRDKVRKEGRKNVHAFVRGHLRASGEAGIGRAPNLDLFRKASYNPYKNDTFVDAETGDPVLRADRVVLDIEHGVWYSNYNDNNNEVN